MTIEFTCPHCGKQTKVDEQYAGTSGPCAGCGKTIAIPGTTAAGPPPANPGGGGLLGLGVAGTVLAVGCAVTGLVVVILILLLLPAVNAVREAARRNQCGNNLRQIGIAMRSYEDRYRSLPPAYIADANGTPMHSWRVLILPFLEHQALYDEYDFSQPWDSPKNLAVAAQMPEVYRCPSTGFLASDETSYMVVAGPGMAFDGSRGMRQREFADGITNTILVVESADHVTWTQPVDLEARQMMFQVNGGPGEIGSDHGGGVAMVVFADGHLNALSEDTPPEAVRAMCTRAGKERIDY